MDFGVVRTSLNTIALMITTVIQYKQHLCSSAMSSFLDSVNAQALNGGLREDFTKHMKTKQNQITLQEKSSIMCLIFNSKPLVAFSSYKLNISEFPVLPNKISCILHLWSSLSCLRSADNLPWCLLRLSRHFYGSQSG